ncbi:MAG: hypothetical protein H0V67_07090 [Geodermatophilaceae bacterium]|nr:hypothetical protein [Geodermatophilaceae bacterium]
MLTALEVWASRDHEADLRDAIRRTDHVVNEVDGLPGVRAERWFPDHLGRPYPTAFIHLDPAHGKNPKHVIESLLEGEPAIAVMGHTEPNVVRVDVRILTDDQSEQVVCRLRTVLA